MLEGRPSSTHPMPAAGGAPTFPTLWLCWVYFVGQCDRLTNGRERPRDCASLHLFASTIVARAYASCEGREASDPLPVRGILEVSVHSQRFDEVHPIFPTCCPAFGGCSHSPISKCFIRKTEKKPRTDCVGRAEDGPRGLVGKGKGLVKQV